MESGLPGSGIRGARAARDAGRTVSAAVADGSAERGAAGSGGRRTLRLDDGIEGIAGVGPARAAELRRAGLLTVGDLLMALPMRYEDRSVRVLVEALRPGQRTGVEVEVLSVRRKGPPGRRQQVEMRIGDDSGEALAVWFNQPYVARRFERGDHVHLFGAVQEYRGACQLVNPVAAGADEGDTSLHVGRTVPVYRRIGSLGPGLLRRLVDAALQALPATIGRLPEHVQADHALLPAREALRQVHYPPAGADLRQWEELRSEPHRALVMAELIDFQVVLGLQRRAAAGESGVARTFDDGALERVLAMLPFALTGAQRRVLGEVVADLRAPEPMHRLVQGDVGCGKTAVLGAAALLLAARGEQVALLAPTEILARQHAATLSAWGRTLGVETLGFSGSDRAGERRARRHRLRSGAPAIAVGTHALLEDDVEFARLGLVIVDEQHRFGVGQRAALRAKGRRQGAQPDLLVTSATPIPRSLALTLYGDLQVSRIDEMPPGRSPVRTRQGDLAATDALTTKFQETMEAGGRAYVVVPAIDAAMEDDDPRPETAPRLAAAQRPVAVDTVAPALRRVLGASRVGVLHGRLDAAAKAAAIDAFVAGDTPVLVATTVVEVGVDVPAATLMVVLDAARFGLAQLHQLRGRVGRGRAPGECWLLASAPLTAGAQARLDTLCRTVDGFEVAERDLELRGAGELLGYRQTGPFGFRIANPRRHYDWLPAAHEVARELIDDGGAPARHYREALRASWQARMRLTRAG